ncbi:MAG: copper-binding protein [Burkholderiales bacterium]
MKRRNVLTLRVPGKHVNPQEIIMKLSSLIAVVVLALSGTAFAQSSAAEHSAHHAPAAASAPTVDGEVRKVDKEAGKITLKHGPIAHLDMPGMTMVFKVANPKLLDAVKPGDKVKFAVDNINGALTVTAIEAVK